MGAGFLWKSLPVLWGQFATIVKMDAGFAAQRIRRLHRSSRGLINVQNFFLMDFPKQVGFALPRTSSDRGGYLLA